MNNDFIRTVEETREKIMSDELRDLVGNSNQEHTIEAIMHLYALLTDQNKVAIGISMLCSLIEKYNGEDEAMAFCLNVKKQLDELLRNVL